MQVSTVRKVVLPVLRCSGFATGRAAADVSFMPFLQGYSLSLGYEAVGRVELAFLRQILPRKKGLGVSQTELVRQMNVSRPYVTKVLHRNVNFSFRMAAKLANVFKMDFSPGPRPQEPEETVTESGHTGRMILSNT